MKILMADDDLDDQLIASLAFKRLNLAHSLDFVNDGQELLDHLNEQVRTKQRMPDLILLDLNMPRKDGRMALNEIKSNPQLLYLNVMIFSTSASETDINHSLKNGAKRCIVKPATFEELMKIFRSISEEVENKPGWNYSIG